MGISGTAKCGVCRKKRELEAGGLCSVCAEAHRRIYGTGGATDGAEDTMGKAAKQKVKAAAAPKVELAEDAQGIDSEEDMIAAAGTPDPTGFATPEEADAAADAAETPDDADDTPDAEDETPKAAGALSRNGRAIPVAVVRRRGLQLIKSVVEQLKKYAVVAELDGVSGAIALLNNAANKLKATTPAKMAAAAVVPGSVVRLRASAKGTYEGMIESEITITEVKGKFVRGLTADGEKVQLPIAHVEVAS